MSRYVATWHVTSRRIRVERRLRHEHGDYDFEVHGNGIDYIRNMEFTPKQSEELLEKIAELHRTHK